jgi:hypothetical protein
VALPLRLVPIDTRLGSSAQSTSCTRDARSGRSSYQVVPHSGETNREHHARICRPVAGQCRDNDDVPRKSASLSPTVGRFAESVDVGKSLARDVRKRAKTVAKPGQGDKADRAKKS